jgi:hypothetical protein
VKKVCFFALFLFPFVVLAQKSVDLDRFYFNVQYRSLPAMRLDSTYRTYSVEVEGTRLMQHFMQELSPEKSVLLEGWRKMEQGGHINIEVKLGDLLPESVSVKERTETMKDRSGQITSTKIFYRQEVIYTFEATASIIDYKGMHIIDEQLVGRQTKYTYKSPEFVNKQMAEGYFTLNSLSLTKDLFRSRVTNAMHVLSERVTNNFGFKEVSSRDFMWIIDSRKHPEYTAHRQAFQRLSDILFSMNANSSPAGIREELKTVIDYFERIKRTYASKSKHDRKIRYASYFNLAVLYYYLDDPQSMIKEASGLALNDYDSKDARGFEQTATWLKNLFQQTNIYTRHFPIDPSSYKGPYEKNDISLK